jgi:hypothetical protein
MYIEIIFDECIFESENQRVDFVDWLAKECFHPETEAYTTNYPVRDKNYHWSIDQYGNNFWVDFIDENGDMIRVSCRYSSLEDKLLDIAYKIECEYGGRIVEELE